ncbi:hypothetical protein LS684_09820 [Cytobacillus spongiae]|uniref:hypothetical protein n=1 Tax=Cytobacillus spongiae TaxID=2901381 RepID=UPI001F439C5B|nr:hypothetical protein [Cytobacillus spongiae]UII57688.1 hypothetical protein LS684_09820 [Cytobacillus spongiae]
MKRNYIPVIMLCVILLLNIVFTQYMVHQYYYENYTIVLTFVGLNILLFPIAMMIYKRDQKLRRRDVK